MKQSALEIKRALSGSTGGTRIPRRMLHDLVGPSVTTTVALERNDPGPLSNQQVVGPEMISARFLNFLLGLGVLQSFRMEQVVFEGLGPFDSTLWDPARTSISVGEAILELWAI